MRNIIVLEFITLDGVMQAPGGPEEDPSNGFTFGGWTAPYFDDMSGKLMAEQMKTPFDLLLGRTTYTIFSSYWPQHEDIWPGINDVTKYVVSTTLTKTEWKNSVILKHTDDIAALKQTDGPNLQVYGSGNLVQSLLREDLVDELWLKIFPITLGSGKRLFGNGTMPKAFTLSESRTTPSGVLFASYKKAGPVKTGSVA